MEKNCINCKWYYNKSCNCKQISFTCDNSIDDQINTFIEDGILWEGIKENLEFKELTSIYLNAIKEAGAIKKNINNKKISSNIEEAETNIIEIIDSGISKLLNNNFENDKMNKVYINKPGDFYCCYWE